jgi:GNAT superfamily N-acetyltransferase
MMTRFELSQAKLDDVGILVQHRLGMFNDMHPELAKEIQASKEQTRQWLIEKLSDGSLVGFIVRTEDGQAAGSGCLWIKKEQPNPTHPRLEAPYLLSMYTEKSYRRRGVARLIVKTAITWSREQGYDRINLHATESGKPLYEEFGFKQTNEMKLKL